jgi:hypothetical protein
MTDQSTNITTLNKVTFGTSSIFKDICVYEKVDPILLFNIIHTADLITFDKKRYEGGLAKLYKTERDLLVAYQYQWIDSINNFVSQWYLPKHGWGRILPRDYLSMSVFHRPTRHTLCNQYLVDLDLVNCHFEIVLDFMKKLNLPCEYIEKYCHNVSFYREEIMNFYGVSKDTAKALFIRLIYGGSLVGWKNENGISTFKDPDILIDISQELQEFMTIVWKNNQHIYNDILNDNPNFYNTCNINKKKKSVMAFWCQSIERYIQEQTINYLVNTYNLQIYHFIPCQDGFMMCKDEFKPEYIDSINNFISTNLNFVSRFIQKPFNEMYKVVQPTIEHIYRPFCLPDLEDAQFAQLLIDATFKYNQIITTGDSKFLEAYMYNNIYWERLPLHNAEFQKGRFDYLETWCVNKLNLHKRVLLSTNLFNQKNVEITDEELINVKATIKDLTQTLKKKQKNEDVNPDIIANLKKKIMNLTLYETYEKDISKARSKIITLSRNSVRKSIIEVFLGKLHKSEIIWDSNPDLFAFTNAIFNLDTREFVKPNKDQYIRTTCGWDWDFNYDNTRVETIQQLVTSILPIEMVRDYFLTFTSVGLSGNKVQRILINTGTGGNGKSLLRELFNKTVGKYSMKIPTEILCSSIKAAGANPVIASMDGMRNIYFSEPDSRYKLCTATFKELTGDAAIVGRQLYSDKTQVNLVATISGDCNALPLFDTVEPDAKDSLVRRLSIVPFITRAVTQKEYDESVDKTHLNIKRNYAENPTWMNDHKQAYFILLLDHYNKYKNIPNVLDMLPTECSDKATVHLNASCNIMAWIDSQLVKVDIETSVPIPLKSLYERFKNEDTFKTYSKQDQRKYSMKYFNNLILTAKEMRGFIKERNSYHNKTRLTSDCLVGYKYLSDEEDDVDTSNL